MKHNKKHPYLVLVNSVLVTQISDQTNEVRLEALRHVRDVAVGFDVTTGAEDVCGVGASHVDQSQKIYNKKYKKLDFSWKNV